MYLYQAQNCVNGKCYYGITNNLSRRIRSHKYAYSHGARSKFYTALRKHGWDNFIWTVLEEGDSDHIARREIEVIACDPDCYNLHPGGRQGYDVSTSERADEWRAKLSAARAGHKPALGMKHTDATKKLCGEYGKLRWDIHGRYPNEVLDYGFTEANKKFGISKTHYYRLKKAAAK